eukprot:GHVQ01010264.1.p2 GENE.GHVQ01010264.1~~GHVQ01010264.1.p2  ORF type:complete len:353 (+),score=45.62 GHVQ01010264.1:4471-5529(+)
MQRTSCGSDQQQDASGTGSSPIGAVDPDVSSSVKEDEGNACRGRNAEGRQIQRPPLWSCFQNCSCIRVILAYFFPSATTAIDARTPLLDSSSDARPTTRASVDKVCDKICQPNNVTLEASKYDVDNTTERVSAQNKENGNISEKISFQERSVSFSRLKGVEAPPASSASHCQDIEFLQSGGSNLSLDSVPNYGYSFRGGRSSSSMFCTIPSGGSTPVIGAGNDLAEEEVVGRTVSETGKGSRQRQPSPFSVSLEGPGVFRGSDDTGEENVEVVSSDIDQQVGSRLPPDTKPILCPPCDGKSGDDAPIVVSPSRRSWADETELEQNNENPPVSMPVTVPIHRFSFSFESLIVS